MAYFRRHLAGDHGAAEDLTQEAFIRLLSLDQREIANPEAYLFQIAANLLRDRGRRVQVRRAYSDMVGADVERLIDLHDAERIALARERVGRVAGILAKLPERTRSIFVLFRLEGVSRKSLAEAYDISPSAVDKHLRRAVTALIADQGEGHE